MMRGQYTILPRLWSAERCAEARRRLDELSVSERDGRIVHATSDSPQTTEFAFTTPHLFNKGEVFEGVYQHPLVLRLVRHFLGEGATIMSLGDNAIEGRINYPGSAEGSGLGEGGLHTDGGATGAYQPPSVADGRQRIVSHVLYMQAIWCLSPFNELTGPTKIVPGAHLAPVTATQPAFADGECVSVDVGVGVGAGAGAGGAGTHAVATLPVPPAPVPGEMLVQAETGDVLLYNTALWQ